MIFDFVRYITNHRIIVDVGACDIKVLHVEKQGRKLKVLEARLIDFIDGGFMTQEESSFELQQVLESMGDHPVILIIPQHLSLSRLTQFSLNPRRELTPYNLRELSGWYHLGDDEEILWEVRPIKKVPGYINSGILTMVRALDVDDQVQRLGLHESNLIRVTTPANALSDSYSRLAGTEESAVLLDIGATTTTVTVVEAGQSVYSGSFPIGGESLTEVISSYLDVPFDQAEMKKREEQLFTDEESTPIPLKAAIESWLNELLSILEIHYGEESIARRQLKTKPILLSGGGAQIPGMEDYLEQVYDFHIQSWDDLLDSDCVEAEGDLRRFLGPLGPGWGGCQRHSLMPNHLRQKRNAQSIQFLSNLASFAVICGVMIFLIVSSLNQFRIYSNLNSELDQYERSFGQIKTIDNLMRERYVKISQYKDLLMYYRVSLDWMRSLNSFKRVMGESDAWMVMIADKKSYFLPKTTTLTNTVLSANLDATTPALVNKSVVPEVTSMPSKPGLIGQIVIPETTERSLSQLNTLVANLNNRDPFGYVDKLPQDIQHSHLNSEFVITNQTYTLQLDWLGYDAFTLSPSWTNRFILKLPDKSKDNPEQSKSRRMPPALSQ